MTRAGGPRPRGCGPCGILAVLLAGSATAAPPSLSFIEDAANWAKVQRLVEDKSAKAAAAMAFLLDNQRYPRPADVSAWKPGIDRQVGQVELDRLTAAAIDAHNALEAELLLMSKAARVVEAAPSGVKLPRPFAPHDVPTGFDMRRLPIGPRTWINPPATRPAFTGLVLRPPAFRPFPPPREDQAAPMILFQVIRSSPAWASWMRQMPQGQTAPLAAALGALGRGDYPAAERLRGELKEPRQTWLLDLMAWHAVWGYNARRRTPDAHTDPNPTLAELEVIEEQNGYRMALNLAPLVLDDRLSLSARWHSGYMNRRNAISHREDDPKLAQAWDRARAAAYGDWGHVSENVSACLGLWTVWGWRTDAAHHRAVVHQQHRAVGVGVEGKMVTVVTGRTDYSPVGKLLK